MMTLKFIWASMTVLMVVVFAVWFSIKYQKLRPEQGWVEMIVVSWAMAIVCFWFIVGSITLMMFCLGG